MELLHRLLANEQAPAASRLFVARLVMHVDRRHLEQVGQMLQNLIRLLHMRLCVHAGLGRLTACKLLL